MPEEYQPGDLTVLENIFVSTLTHDMEAGNNLQAPKWQLRSKTARTCILAFFKGYDPQEIDASVDRAQEIIRGNNDA